ncbi:MAG TPA: hypothetical protein VNA19_07540 [Pyrinomonadaceae bacterium]|jgi:hypothetical protein|nr:hypothetical protein [Pyrinomonadaceae bacterium]
MVDSEVENTLREIRERVRAGAQPSARAPLVESERVFAPADTATPEGASAAEARARIEANLKTIERTWNRLPPLTSYRHGWAARVELWFKRQIKRATHWFTWEQVNFNAAVHHSLRDALDALSTYEQHEQQRAQVHAQQLAQLRTELDAALNAALQKSRAEKAEAEAETHARFAALEARQNADGAELRHHVSGFVEQLRREIEALRREQHAHLEAVRQEERERIEYLTDEQRVAFKQLSLEATETAVAADRARRALELRLDELEKIVTSDK